MLSARDRSFGRKAVHRLPEPAQAQGRAVEVGKGKGVIPELHPKGEIRSEGRASSRDGDVVRVLLWGAPEFAEPPLRALIGEGFEVVGVVTQPDKPQGRSRQIIPSPGKQIARGE